MRTPTEILDRIIAADRAIDDVDTLANAENLAKEFDDAIAEAVTYVGARKLALIVTIDNAGWYHCRIAGDTGNRYDGVGRELFAAIEETTKKVCEASVAEIRRASAAREQVRGFMAGAKTGCRS